MVTCTNLPAVISSLGSVVSSGIKPKLSTDLDICMWTFSVNHVGKKFNNVFYIYLATCCGGWLMQMLVVLCVNPVGRTAV